MHISPVVTRTDLEDFHEVEAARNAFDHVGLPADPIEEWLPLLDDPVRGGQKTLLLVGREGDKPVGLITISFPQHDNLNAANAEVAVHPSARRQGHGKLLVDEALRLIRIEGRTRVFAEIATPPGGSEPLAHALLSALGAKAVLGDLRRMLDLTARPPGPRGPVPDGYRVEQWVDRAPADLVEGCAYLMGRMTLDAPMGAMDYEPEKWDADRYRKGEIDSIQRKRKRIASAVVHEATGAVAGITDIGVNHALTETAYQWDTIVDPDHRGHGLGLVLKTWNHAYLVEQVQDVRYLNTWNAASNTYMIAVNDALGFVPVEQWTEYQLDL